MDTTKITTQTDSIFKIGDSTTSHHRTFETIKQNDCDCWTNVCDCKLLSDLIWPITILLIILIFYRRILTLLTIIGDRAKRIKVGGIEVELEELNKKTEVLEKIISDKGLNFKGQGGLKQPLDFNYKITSDLPTEILKISIEIEKTLRSIYDATMKGDKKGPLAVSVLIESLRENKVIDLELTKLLRQFWMFRNSIVHAVSYTVTEKEFLAFVDIGIRVLKILKTTQSNIGDNNGADDTTI